MAKSPNKASSGAAVPAVAAGSDAADAAKAAEEKAATEKAAADKAAAETAAAEKAAAEKAAGKAAKNGLRTFKVKTAIQHDGKDYSPDGKDTVELDREQFDALKAVDAVEGEWDGAAE